MTGLFGVNVYLFKSIHFLPTSSWKVNNIFVVSPPENFGMHRDVKLISICNTSNYGMTYTSSMKEPEYTEGPKALENFERGMIALFKVPKTAIGKARKKGRKLTTKPKRKRPDKG